MKNDFTKNLADGKIHEILIPTFQTQNLGNLTLFKVQINIHIWQIFRKINFCKSSTSNTAILIILRKLNFAIFQNLKKLATLNFQISAFLGQFSSK